MKHNKQIIESMILITQQRDRDSLEFCLVATIAEIVPANTISLFRLIDGIESGEIEETIRLEITHNERDEVKYIWDKEPKLIKIPQVYVDCITSDESRSYAVDTHRSRLILPITRNENPEGILVIDTAEDLSSCQYIVEGLTKIYENYLLVLHESEFDTLTGLRNRRTFDKKIDFLLKEQKARESQKNNEGIVERRHYDELYNPWLAVVDIDHFKKINDTFGHIYGDEVLLLLAQKMKAGFRRNDLLFRFGGEEFVIILEPIEGKMVGKVLERFRKTVDEFSFPQVGNVTVSIGYSRIGKNDFPMAILENADKALYYAKKNGRNCVHCYEDLVEKGFLEAAKVTDDVELF